MKLAYEMPPNVLSPFLQQTDHLATLIIASKSYSYNYSYSSKDIDYGELRGFHNNEDPGR